LGITIAGGVPIAVAGRPPFTVTTGRDTDKVTISFEKDRTVFVVRSPTGIGRAVIERTGDNWPAGVIVRLHVKGLESFRVANGKVALAVAVSGRGGAEQGVRVWKDGKEDAPLDAKSPFWADVRRVAGGDGKPADDGHFEVPLPRAFFEGNPKSIELNRIDFYR
jgi:hypothetical protein